MSGFYLEEDVAALRARVTELEAQVKRWKDKEVDRAICCIDNEKRVAELEKALMTAKEALRWAYGVKIPPTIDRALNEIRWALHPTGKGEG